jgi:hypothetical protein
MAQTTESYSWVDCDVFLSTDDFSSSNVNVGGFSNSIEISGGERVTGAAYTADGDTAIITNGKRQPTTITARFVYTESANQPYNMINDAYEAGSNLYIRWIPDGNTSGNYRYTSGAGIVKNPVYPTGDAESGDVLISELVLEVPEIAEDTVS